MVSRPHLHDTGLRHSEGQGSPEPFDMHMKHALHQDANTRPLPWYCLRPVHDHPQKVQVL